MELEKNKKKKKKKDEDLQYFGLFQTKNEPKKSFQTFMRNQNKLYVNSINVIDRKSAILVRLNAAILTAVIIFFENIQTFITTGFYIAFVLIACSFISLMFAVNASRPHMFAVAKEFKQKIKKKHCEIEESIFSIGTNADIPLDTYERAFDKVMHSQELQVGNQVRTMYLLEKRLKNSYLHLELAYITFMAGYVLAVVGFLYSVCFFICD